MALLSKLRPYIPNRLRPGRMALVPMRDGAPDPRAWAHIEAVQLVGGRRWSLSIIRSGEPRSVREPS